MKRVSNLQEVFAENVKNRRKRKAMTQAELASAIGVSTSFITEIETVRKAPSFTTIEKIANALDTPAWTLFSTYSDKVKDKKEDGDEITRVLLKNKINDVIDEILK